MTSIVSACKDSIAGNQIQDHTFQYAAYDSTGIPLLSGWFSMNYTDSISLSGQWHFRPTNYAKNIGPQTGDGRLVGGVWNGQVWIELNPQFRDNNVELVGTMEGYRFYGQWTWLTFAGVTNKGRFEAVNIAFGQMW